MRPIKNIKELKKLAAKEEGIDCFILLKGNCKSSKHIKYDKENKKFEVFNLIDETEQLLNEEELNTASNIGEALKKKSLILED